MGVNRLHELGQFGDEHRAVHLHRQQHEQSAVSVLSITIFARRNLLLLYLFTHAVFGQETILFHADLLPIAGAPAGTPAGTANFYIVTYSGTGERRIAGSAEADLNPNLKIVFARIDTASGFVTPTPDIQMSCPSVGGGGPCEWFSEWSIPYSDAIIGEMQRGEWRVTLGLETSPDAIISGQLEAVPEPAPFLLLGLGVLPLLALRRKRSA
jgi:hypothetical protein